MIKKEEDREDLIDEILGIITFETISEGKRVFRFGDYGDKFYIILKGTVSVHVPTKVQIKEDPEDRCPCKLWNYLTCIAPTKRRFVEVAQFNEGQ